MPTLCLMQQIGTRKPTVIIPAEGLKFSDSANVYFCVQSECEEQAQAVAYAVQAVNDVFKLGSSQAVHNTNGLSLSVIPPSSWYEDSWRPDGRYIYLYTTPVSLNHVLLEPFKLWTEKNIFYVGEGTGDELFGLIDQASSMLDELVNEHSDEHKLHLVKRFILGAGKEGARNMVRKVAFFSGEYEATACAAAKDYLINHLYGLEKKNKVDTIQISCDWISRPKGMLPNTSEWQGLLSEFLSAH